LSERYIENQLSDPVVTAYLEDVGAPYPLPHIDPASETAINAAVKSGRNAELVELMEWEPANLDKEDDEDGD